MTKSYDRAASLRPVQAAAERVQYRSLGIASLPHHRVVDTRPLWKGGCTATVCRQDAVELNPDACSKARTPHFTMELGFQLRASERLLVRLAQL
jgi:hypothetical protein